MEELIYHAADLMSKAKNVCVLTGAGISQESGLMTFRGEGGIWDKYDFNQLATLEGFLGDPELVWKWYDERRVNFNNAGPNNAHKALAQLEPRYKEFTLVTQNIDGLHKQAGSKNIVELHGNIFRVRCMGGKCPVTENMEIPLQTLPPKCESCGEMLRPDVVWFGESLPMDAISSAMEAAQRADLAITVGTSAVVYPAAHVPAMAKQNGAALIEINAEPTPLTDIADVALHGKAGEILPLILAAME